MTDRGASFFGPIRTQVPPRSAQRWIGGVAGGIAQRAGIDPLLVRALTVALALVFPVLLAAYGIAWAFMPDARDGRILLHEAINLRFDGAQLLAAIFILFGGLPSPVRGSFIFGWNDGWNLLVLALLAVGVWWLLSQNSPRPRPATPSPHSPSMSAVREDTMSTPRTPTSHTTHPSWSDEVTTSPVATAPPAAAAVTDPFVPSAPPASVAATQPFASGSAVSDSATTELHTPDLAETTQFQDATTTSSFATSSDENTTTTLSDDAGAANTHGDAGSPGGTAGLGDVDGAAGAGGTGGPSGPQWTWRDPAGEPDFPPVYTAPAKPRANPTVAFAVLGVWALGVAIMWALRETETIAFYNSYPAILALWSAVALVALCGAGMVINALLGRQSMGLATIGTFAALSLLPMGLGFAIESTPATPVTSHGFNHYYTDGSWAPATLDEATQGVSVDSSSFVVDLKNFYVPAGETVTIPIQSTFSDLTISIGPGVPVEIQASVSGGSLEWPGFGIMNGYVTNTLNNYYDTDGFGTIIIELDATFGHVFIDQE